MTESRYKVDGSASAAEIARAEYQRRVLVGRLTDRGCTCRRRAASIGSGTVRQRAKAHMARGACNRTSFSC